MPLNQNDSPSQLIIKTANLTGFHICLLPHLAFNQYALKRNNEEWEAVKQIFFIVYPQDKHWSFPSGNLGAFVVLPSQRNGNRRRGITLDGFNYKE